MLLKIWTCICFWYRIKLIRAEVFSRFYHQFPRGLSWYVCLLWLLLIFVFIIKRFTFRKSAQSELKGCTCQNVVQEVSWLRELGILELFASEQYNRCANMVCDLTCKPIRILFSSSSVFESCFISCLKHINTSGSWLWYARFLTTHIQVRTI